MTLIELFAGIFVMGVPLITFVVVSPRFGIPAGIAAGVLSAVAAVRLVIAFYRWGGRLHQKHLRELDEKYPDVYRVTALPADTSRFLMAEYAEIEIGDYGWEAEPIHSDGLTYLHGLTTKWRVVWHAGFRPDQIERVGPKPHTQYYLPFAWRVAAGPEAPVCPFPVKSGSMADLGYPVIIIRPFVQGQRMA